MIVCVAGGGQESREPIEARHQAVLHGVGRDLAGPAGDARHAEAAFHDCPFALRERRRAAVGPGETFGAVVGGEDDDRVFFFAHVLELLQHEADVVIELGHAGFLFRPAIFRVARRFPLRREMRDDVHARRIQPAEERLAVLLGLVDELDRQVADLVIDGLHPLGIERAGVFDLLLADLAPARHLGRVILVRRPAVNHVARADDVQQFLRIVRDAPGLPSRPGDTGSRRIRRSRGRSAEIRCESPRWFLPNWPVA